VNGQSLSTNGKSRSLNEKRILQFEGISELRFITGAKNEHDFREARKRMKG
jgi:hypothetical protein